MTSIDLDLSKYQLGWSDDVDYVYKPRRVSTSSLFATCR